MPKLLLDNSEMPDAVWRTIPIAPWNGDLRMKVRPYTQILRDVVLQRVKKSKWMKPHGIIVDGETIAIESDENRANQEEFLKAVVEDWSGVEGDPACTAENKVLLRASSILVMHLIQMTNAMAGVKVEDETGN